jgi:hypothetical protein
MVFKSGRLTVLRPAASLLRPQPDRQGGTARMPESV